MLLQVSGVELCKVDVERREHFADEVDAMTPLGNED